MIDRLEKRECCGCTSCSSVCPTKAIQMLPDEEGFVYPVIDKKKCIACGACERSCPVINAIENTDLPLSGYVVRNKNYEILNNSASGGFFSAVADYTIKRGGIVFGAAYDESLNVCHMSAERPEEIYKFRTSKYVQSDMGSVYENVKNNLIAGRLVCFSGTPCQVAGLQQYLKKKYENLITVDLICHGVPSPNLWRKYLEWQNEKNKSNVVACNFRKKTYGYHNGTLELIFENGKHYYGSARNDMMIKCFFNEIASRPSCYDCAFKCAKHTSDFTVFDCWHASNIADSIEKDDDKGYTNLFINSDVGFMVFKDLKQYLESYPADIETMIHYDGVMVRRSATPHKDRKKFYQSLCQNGIEITVQKYLPISKTDRLMVTLRAFLYKVGMLNAAKAIDKAQNI